MPRKLTTEEFIEKARAIHGDKYDYSKAEYVDTCTDVVIVCPIHGEFPQKPVDHTSRKRGCPQCGVEKSAEAKRKTAEEFIKEAKAIHGDYYDYSKVEYRGTKQYVKIICKRCGCTFPQKPEVHLGNKSGCPDCNHGSIKIDKTSYLYILKADDDTKIKVGITNNTFKRLERLHRDTPFDFHALKIYKFPKGTQIVRLEKDIHDLIAEHNAGLRGFSGATEWFWYSQNVVDLVEKRVVEILEEKLYHINNVDVILEVL